MYWSSNCQETGGTDISSSSAYFVVKSPNWKMRPYHCEYRTCGKSFMRKDHLDPHSTTHSSLRPLPCTKCPKNFKNKSALATNIKTHDQERSYQCDFPHCGKSFRSMGNLRLHQTTHEDREKFKIFECPSCPRRFAKPAHLKSHEEAVHLKLKPFGCPLCSRTFYNKENMNNHLRFVHLREKPLKCDECGKEYRTKITLHAHRETHKSLSDRTSYPCRVSGCGKIFRQQLTLKGHHNKHHAGGGFTCGVANCLKKFTLKGNMRRHEALHGRQTDFSCVKCAKIFSNLKLLEKHGKIMHGKRHKCEHDKCVMDFYDLTSLFRHQKTHLARLKCYFCPKLSKTHQERDNHLRIHIMERPYSCQILNCGYTSGQSSNLRNHEKTHCKARARFQCDLCPKEFLTKGSLNKHNNRVHLKLKPFPCTFCGRGFYNRDGLKVHISGFHLQERPYKCGACGAEFTMKCTLQSHWDSHHAVNRKLYECVSCGKTFLRRISLQQHTESEHSGGEGFRCRFEGCDKVAKTLKQLKRHEGTHVRRGISCS